MGQKKLKINQASNELVEFAYLRVTCRENIFKTNISNRYNSRFIWNCFVYKVAKTVGLRYHRENTLDWN